MRAASVCFASLHCMYLWYGYSACMYVCLVARLIAYCACSSLDVAGRNRERPPYSRVQRQPGLLHFPLLLSRHSYCCGTSSTPTNTTTEPIFHFSCSLLRTKANHTYCNKQIYCTKKIRTHTLGTTTPSRDHVLLIADGQCTSLCGANHDIILPCPTSERSQRGRDGTEQTSLCRTYSCQKCSYHISCGLLRRRLVARFPR